MSIQKKHEELIESSYKELETLKNEVTQLEDIRKNIEILIRGNMGLPPLFLELYQKLEILSNTYTNGINDITRKYLSDANTYFVERLIELQKEIDNLKSQIERVSNIDFTGLFEELQKTFINLTRKDLQVELNKFDEKINILQKEISRLVNTDFINLFEEFQKTFIELTRKDLKVELKKFDEISINLQAKIEELKKQVERLEKINLEKHFAELQKTLSEIFGAINAINITLSNIIQTLTGIVQSLGNIQTTLDTNHKESKQLLHTFIEANEKHLVDQDDQAANNLELLETKMKLLSEQNNLLIKKVKSNKIIQILGLTLILIVLIYLAFAKQ